MVNSPEIESYTRFILRSLNLLESIEKYNLKNEMNFMAERI